MLASCERVVEPVQVSNRVIVELVKERHRFVEHILWVAAKIHGARTRAQSPKSECDPCGGPREHDKAGDSRGVFGSTERYYGGRKNTTDQSFRYTRSQPIVATVLLTVR